MPSEVLMRVAIRHVNSWLALDMGADQCRLDIPRLPCPTCIHTEPPQLLPSSTEVSALTSFRSSNLEDMMSESTAQNFDMYAVFLEHHIPLPHKEMSTQQRTDLTTSHIVHSAHDIVLPQDAGATAPEEYGRAARLSRTAFEHKRQHQLPVKPAVPLIQNKSSGLQDTVKMNRNNCTACSMVQSQTLQHIHSIKDQ